MNTIPSTFLPASACLSRPPAGQMRSGVCVPFGHHAMSWWITPHAAELAWLIITCLILAWLWGALGDWFTGQYEVTRKGWRLIVTRRWYGIRAWVIRRGREDDDEPERFQVFQVDTENSEVPWLKVASIDTEDADPFWAPVTDFAPEAVRKLRPWIFRYRRLRWPVLFAYAIVPRPDSYARTDA